MISLIIIMCSKLKVILMCIQSRIMVLVSTIQANIIVLVCAWVNNDCVGPSIIALMCTQANIVFIDYSLESKHML